MHYFWKILNPSSFTLKHAILTLIWQLSRHQIQNFYPHPIPQKHQYILNKAIWQTVGKKVKSLFMTSSKVSWILCNILPKESVMQKKLCHAAPNCKFAQGSHFGLVQVQHLPWRTSSIAQCAEFSKKKQLSLKKKFKSASQFDTKPFHL